MPLLPRTLPTQAPHCCEHGAVLKFATFPPPTETARRSSLQRSYVGKEEEIEPETLHRARRHRTESSQEETMVILQPLTASLHARRSEQEFDVRQCGRHPSHSTRLISNPMMRQRSSYKLRRPPNTLDARSKNLMCASAGATLTRRHNRHEENIARRRPAN